MPTLRPYLVLDLGSYRTRAVRLGKLDQLEELSAVTLSADPNKRPQKVLAVGNDAPDAAQALKEQAELVWPIDGAIQDYIVCEAMLRFYSRKLLNYRWLKPAVIVSVWAGVTEVEKRAVYDATLAGVTAYAAYLLPDALAVGVAADKVMSDKPWLIVQAGAGAASTIVMYEGGLTHQRKFPLAGNHLDKTIRRALWDELGRRVDLLTCRELKHRVGAVGKAASAAADESAELVDEAGVRLDAEALAPVVRAALERGLTPLAEELRWFVRELPEKEQRALDRTHVLLAGGTARLPGFADWLAEQLCRDVDLQPEPDQAVMRGLKIVAANLPTHRPRFKQPPDMRK